MLVLELKLDWMRRLGQVSISESWSYLELFESLDMCGSAYRMILDVVDTRADGLNKEAKRFDDYRATNS